MLARGARTVLGFHAMYPPALNHERGRVVGVPMGIILTFQEPTIHCLATLIDVIEKTLELVGFTERLVINGDVGHRFHRFTPHPCLANKSQ
jgi:hypothetical protein